MLPTDAGRGFAFFCLFALTPRREGRTLTSSTSCTCPPQTTGPESQPIDDLAVRVAVGLSQVPQQLLPSLQHGQRPLLEALSLWCVLRCSVMYLIFSVSAAISPRIRRSRARARRTPPHLASGQPVRLARAQQLGPEVRSRGRAKSTGPCLFEPARRFGARAESRGRSPAPSPTTAAVEKSETPRGRVDPGVASPSLRFATLIMLPE